MISLLKAKSADPKRKDYGTSSFLYFTSKVNIFGEEIVPLVVPSCR